MYYITPPAEHHSFISYRLRTSRGRVLMDADDPRSPVAVCVASRHNPGACNHSTSVSLFLILRERVFPRDCLLTRFHGGGGGDDDAPVNTEWERCSTAAVAALKNVTLRLITCCIRLPVNPPRISPYTALSRCHVTDDVVDVSRAITTTSGADQNNCTCLRMLMKH